MDPHDYIPQVSHVSSHAYSRTNSGSPCDSLASELATPGAGCGGKYNYSIIPELSTDQFPSRMVPSVCVRDSFASASGGVTPETASPGPVHGLELALVRHQQFPLAVGDTSTGLSLEQSNDHETSDFDIETHECHSFDSVSNSENASLTSPHPTGGLTGTNCVYDAAQDISSDLSEVFDIAKVNESRDAEDVEDPDSRIHINVWLSHHCRIPLVSSGNNSGDGRCCGALLSPRAEVERSSDEDVFPNIPDASSDTPAAEIGTILISGASDSSGSRIPFAFMYVIGAPQLLEETSSEQSVPDRQDVPMAGPLWQALRQSYRCGCAISKCPVASDCVTYCVCDAAQDVSSDLSKAFDIAKVNESRDAVDVEDPDSSIHIDEWLAHHCRSYPSSGNNSGNERCCWAMFSHRA
jgi:hypothetical protein